MTLERRKKNKQDGGKDTVFETLAGLPQRIKPEGRGKRWGANIKRLSVSAKAVKKKKARSVRRRRREKTGGKDTTRCE